MLPGVVLALIGLGFRGETLRAGDEVSDGAVLPGVVQALRRLCGASAPLAAELFCDGALGKSLRITRRLVASKLRREGELAAERAFCECAGQLLDAFRVAVPQARAHALALAPAVQGTCCVPARVPALTGCPGAQVAKIWTWFGKEVRACMRLARPLSWLCPARRHALEHPAMRLALMRRWVARRSKAYLTRPPPRRPATTSCRCWTASRRTSRAPRRCRGTRSGPRTRARAPWRTWRWSGPSSSSGAGRAGEGHPCQTAPARLLPARALDLSLE